MRSKIPFLLACVCALVLATGVARAEDMDLAALQAKANQTVAQVEQAAQEYEKATAEVESLASQVASNEALMASIEARLPEQRARTAASVKNLYIFQQSAPGLLELMLSANSFSDFITTVRYIDAIHTHNVTEIHALTKMESELAQTKATLASERDAATKKQQEALAALQQVSIARNELQDHIDTLRAEAAASADREQQQQAQASARQVAEAASKAVEALPAPVARLTQPAGGEAVADEGSAAAQAKDGQADDATASQDAPAPEQAAPQPTDNQKDNQKDDAAEPPAPTAQEDTGAGDASTDSWAARIDAYLAGSPLAGMGSVFAQAAAEYGVDPRISPAISCVESGKGSVCFLPHNAWGWGSASWPDWPSAIRGHVAGFASVYGSTITLEGAKAYAGTDIYEYWYSLVQGEMSSI